MMVSTPVYLHDVGDLLAIGDVLFDEIVFGAGGMTPAQEPIGAYDHA
jgi:hypothetical protein